MLGGGGKIATLGCFFVFTIKFCLHTYVVDKFHEHGDFRSGGWECLFSIGITVFKALGWWARVFVLGHESAVASWLVHFRK